MSDTLTTHSLRTIFRFPFERDGWQQAFLIGSGLIFLSFLIPIVPSIFVAGYTVQVLRRTIEGHALSLPRWDDWGALGLDGLRVTGINAIYLLPGVIIYSSGTFLYMLIAFMMPVFTELVGSGSWVAFFWPITLFSSMILFILALVLGGIIFLAGIAPLPMAVAHSVAEDSFAAAFRIRQWGRLLRRNLLGYLIAWVITAGLAAIAYIILGLLYTSLVLCLLIPLVAAPILFYLGVIHAALFGQAYREAARA